jgi:hypothetical protein
MIQNEIRAKYALVVCPAKTAWIVSPGCRKGAAFAAILSRIAMFVDPSRR